MIVRERFPISELVRRTGVPGATIHHYLRLGLLPAPRRVSSNRFLYDERHVQAVQLVRMLRERRRLPLKTIRRILPDLLDLEGEQAFRPEMWDQAVGLRLRGAARRAPAVRLLEAATEAFSKRGFGEVNVDDVCRAARIAKGSFYRHYRSKEELLFAVVETAVREVADEFEEAAASVDRLDRRTAAAILARCLERRLPIMLDVVARAVQRRPGYAEAAARSYHGLARDVGANLPRASDPVVAGEELIRHALGMILRGVAQAPDSASTSYA